MDASVLQAYWDAQRDSDVIVLPRGTYTVGRRLDFLFRVGANQAKVDARGVILNVPSWAWTEPVVRIAAGSKAGVLGVKWDGMHIEGHPKYLADGKLVGVELCNLKDSTVSGITLRYLGTGVELIGDGCGCVGNRLTFSATAKTCLRQRCLNGGWANANELHGVNLQVIAGTPSPMLIDNQGGGLQVFGGRCETATKDTILLQEEGGGGFYGTYLEGPDGSTMKVRYKKGFTAPVFSGCDMRWVQVEAY